MAGAGWGFLLGLGGAVAAVAPLMDGLEELNLGGGLGVGLDGGIVGQVGAHETSNSFSTASEKTQSTAKTREVMNTRAIATTTE